MALDGDAPRHVPRAERPAQRHAQRTAWRRDDERLTLEVLEPAERYRIKSRDQHWEADGTPKRILALDGGLPLLVGDQRHQGAHSQAGRDHPPAVLLGPGNSEPDQASPFAKRSIGPPHLAEAADLIEHDINPVAGEFADSLDKVLGAVVDGSGAV